MELFTPNKPLSMELKWGEPLISSWWNIDPVVKRSEGKDAVPCMLASVLQTSVAHRMRLGTGLIEYKFETIASHEDKSLFGSQGRLAPHHLSWVQCNITGHLPFGFGQAPWLTDKLLSIMLGSFSLLQSL
ncbi:hypothetical protein POTOM_020972 [Populus tomentosa]|uniref:Uncharacterized protein n=1 Tax=Populus tomentosa TaxID=118781 RepID=A0A8X7ZWN6_POPTO|nr:hypothetical protein POTOM_020972 [Populus tomentosa]